MDFHFTYVKEEIAGGRKKHRKLTHIARLFLPVFLLSAILPFFLMFVLNPPKLGFFTQADTAPVLRIWFTPSKIVSSQGRDVELKVYASFESDGLLLPEVDFRLVSSGQVVLLSDSLKYPRPFRGEIEAGVIKVRTLAPGVAIVSIDPEDVKLGFLDTKVEIKTSPATITVR
ncbi:hypothetical protein C4564_00965 [Candidatus Microgenomates bacterium]|nr:MAG: hypothetical protein C4564_00965 [Candidatus Microgenomates bacterium]